MDDMQTANLDSQRANNGVNIGELLNQLEAWRSQKGNRSEAIPDDIWQQVFYLEPQFGSKRLRAMLNISNKQYDNKRNELLGNHQQNDDGPEQPDNITPQPTTFCQAKVKPSFPKVDTLNIETIIVEVHRADGNIMKVHTTTSSFQDLIQAFCFAKGNSPC
jgi:hypothetical protein